MSEENQNSEENKSLGQEEKPAGEEKKVTPSSETEIPTPEPSIGKVEKKEEPVSTEAAKPAPVKKEVPAKKAAPAKEETVEEPKVFSPERQALIDVISSWMSDLEFTDDNTEFLTVICKPEQLHKLAENMKNNDKTQFDYMFCLSGVDYPDHMMVVYHFKSTTLNHQMVMKVKIDDRENPVVDTLCDLWQTAELHEREVYDLFGIKFNNHPDLRRLFLTDDWVGYPMRKDYVDEVNIVTF